MHAFAILITALALAPSAHAQATKVVALGTTHGAEFSLLTYNIAGLPAILSRSDPERNIPRIGPLLNLYDLALVQEDFAYHVELDSGPKHPHRSLPLLPGPRVSLGDGLNRFSRMPFTRFERVSWLACHGRFSDGSDCLTAKGFSVAEHELAPGYSVDVYNVHMDSGSAPGDLVARENQISQLMETIRNRSRGKAVIVAGDTNMGPSEDHLLDTFTGGAGLRDACRTLTCRERALIDRVLYRGGLDVDLVPRLFRIDHRFVTEERRPLSDHLAVGVVFRWAKRLTAAQPTDENANDV